MLRTDLVKPIPMLMQGHADLFGQKTAYRDSQQSVSHGELLQRTGRIAGHLADLGLKPGDRVAIQMGNSVAAVESYLGVLRADGVGVPVNPRDTDDELGYVLDDSGATALITEAPRLAQAHRMRAARPWLRVVVAGHGAPPLRAGMVPFETLATAEPPGPARDGLGLDEVAWLVYTSGTTGRPKGVLSSQRNCLWSVAACYAPVMGLSGTDRLLWPLPMFHSLSHILCVIGVTAVGASAHLVDGASPEAILTALRNGDPTFLAGVPTLYRRLLRAVCEDRLIVPSLRVGLVTGAASDDTLAGEVERLLHVPLIDSYGSTETCGAITSDRPDEPHTPGSCGRPVPGLELRIVDPDSAESCPPGTPGEVWVRGPNVMLGYHNQPEATDAALAGGWLHTGDLGLLDADGRLHLKGRRKELIIRGGENIHPADIERVLTEVPGVADAAVVAAPHHTLGQVPVAFAVPGPGGLSGAELVAACREKLAYHKVPVQLYETSEIPRTASGKVVRHRLLTLPARLRAVGTSHHTSLHALRWVPLPPLPAGAPAGGSDGTRPPSRPLRVAVAGPGTALLPDLGEGTEVVTYPSLDALLPDLAAGATVPDVTVLPPAALLRGSAPSGGALRDRVCQLCARLCACLDDELLAATTFVVLTGETGVAGTPPESGGRGQAALWGAVRACQRRRPGRLLAVDTGVCAAENKAEATGSARTEDATTTGTTGTTRKAGRTEDAGPTASPGPFAPVALPHAPAPLSMATLRAVLAAGEPQSAVRAGALLVPRIAPVPAPVSGEVTSALDPERTTVITGADRLPGSLLARHFATTGQARHLLLLGTGDDSETKMSALTRLGDELSALGAHVRVVACAWDDPGGLRAALDRAPRPLGLVVHTDAGAPVPAEDALEAAFALDALLTGADAVPLVICTSSVMADASGAPALAAVSGLLEALVVRRRAQGLPAMSIMLGRWAVEEENLSRVVPGLLPVTEGLAMIDAALASGEVVAAVQQVKLPAPGWQEAGTAQLDGPAGVGPGAAASDVASAASLGAELAALSDRARRRRLLELVRTEAAAVRGLDDAAVLDDGTAFKDIGFDSASAVQLCGRLAAATGLGLPATLTFDHPTPAAVARHLQSLMSGDKTAERGAASAAGAGGEQAGSGADGRDGQRMARGPAHAIEAPLDTDPVVIVSMGCRYPGDVRTPEDLWRLLVDERDAVSDFPADRGWDLAALAGPGDGRGTSTTLRGGFLHDAGDFDAAFFGISPREALAMDPQHRLLLEVAWEACERAGIAPDALRGSRTGVFVGSMFHDYAGEPDEIPAEADGYVGTGTAGSVASGRIAYTFGFEGPALTVDTACSSSLVAVHLAAQSLRRGECSLALAGGVAVMATPATFTEFSRQSGLAPDGRCKSFDASADGTGWAEGVGVLLLERLADARRHGHPVHAVLRGSAVNQDGASNGLTAPSGRAQEEVIRAALADARLVPDDVDVVEAHGTGTRLGDPIEARALLAAYGRRDPALPLLLGSLKSNIGHAQAAAGVAGVIKTVLAMRHGVVPRSLHLTRPTREVDWASAAVHLATRATAWPERGRPKRAGVSSFGVSGTNVHVVLEQAPETPAQAAPRGPTPPAVPWVLSARTPSALRSQAAALAAHLSVHTTQGPLDVAHALAGKQRFVTRTVLVIRDRADGIAQLKRLADERHTGPDAVGPDGGLGLLFTGQGSQRTGMGQELHRFFPVFADAFDAACAAFGKHLSLPLREVVFDPQRQRTLERTEFAQPALFALETALFRLLEDLGVQPDFVAGHSLGELSAAHAAGVLDLTDATALVAARGRLMQRLPPGGAMVAVELPEEQVRPLLADAVGAVGLASINGPEAVVLSGEENAVHAVAARCAALGARTSRLRVSHAFHSALMEPVLAPFRAIAEKCAFAPARVPVVSGLTGAVAGDELSTPGYWVRQIREPVRFHDALRTLGAQHVSHLLELGPDGVLSAMAGDTFAGTTPRIGEAPAAPSPVTACLLRRDHPETQALLGALGRVHTYGLPVDWTALLAPGGPRPVTLPTYAFQRTRYWLPSVRRPAAGASVVRAGLTVVHHPLLTAAVELPDGGLVLTGRLALRDQTWLTGHQVDGQTLCPATAWVEAAVYAATKTGCALSELVLRAPLVVPPDDAVQLRISAGAPDGSGQRTLTVDSRPESAPARSAWTRHATGRLAPDEGPGTSAPDLAPDPAASAWPPPCAVPVPVTGAYDRLAADGLQFGPAFRVLKAVWRSGDTVWAELELPGTHSMPGPYHAHPALLVGVLQAAQLSGVPATPEGHRRVPAAWHDVALEAGDTVRLRVRLEASGSDTLTVRLTDVSGRAVGQMGALVLRSVPLPTPGRAAAGVGHSTGADRRQELLELVRAEATAVLGLPAEQRVASGHSFRDAGMTSLTAVELRNRIAAVTGVRLPASAAFEHTTPQALADHLRVRVTGGPGVAGPVGRADLAAEVRLDEAIRPPVGLACPVGTPTEVLLTGATGFLGAFLLRDLMRGTQARVHCLVRAGDESEARERLRANLAFYRLEHQVPLDRVTVHVGDLAEPLLGLSPALFDALARTADAIVHAGSAVNWLYPYRELRATNVGGIQEILRLAALHRPTPVHHVSTTAVFGHRGTPGAPVTTTTPLAAPDGLTTGYQQSKWVAESIARVAAERGLPVTVYRPDVVCGDTEHGACQTEDFVWLSLKGCLQAGAVPSGAEALFSLVPVDYVSAAIVALLKLPRSAGATYHLYNRHQVRLTDMIGRLRAAGYPIEDVPRAEWHRRVERRPGNAAMPLLDTFHDVTSGRRVRPEFDVTETERALAGTGITCPDIGESLFTKLVGFFVNTAYFPPSPITLDRLSQNRT